MMPAKHIDIIDDAGNRIVRLDIRRYATAQRLINALRRHGALPAKSMDKWTEAELALLGTASDRDVAKAIGRTVASVHCKRAILGIGPRKCAEKRKWAEEELALLGTMPDEEVAEKTGRGVRAVTQARNKIGVSLVPGARKTRKPMPKRIAEWTDEEIAMLGTARDEDVAKATGRTFTDVRRTRRRLGIQHYPNPDRRIGRPSRPLSKEDKWAMKMRKKGMTIQAIADELGVTKQAIYQRLRAAKAKAD